MSVTSASGRGLVDSAAETAKARQDTTLRAFLRQRIIELDDSLSRNAGVHTFANDPSCLLRLAVGTAPCNVTLDRGLTIERGSAIIDLHLWNEHVPIIPCGGPTLAWAREVCRRLQISLHHLARLVQSDPDLSIVGACRARTTFSGLGCVPESMTRLIERCGFEDVDEGPRGAGAWTHDFFENFLIVALVWAHNPRALCQNKLFRVRRPIWISRGRLIERYGEP